MMNEYETYQTYLALKLHFEGSYDYFKYHGKTSTTVESFEKRKDRFKFGKISRTLNDSEITEYFVSNLIRGKKWIGEFDKKNWIQHKKVIQSLEYFFINDTENLLTNSSNFDIIFQCADGKHPKLVKAYLGKKITLETLVIFEKLLSYTNLFNEEIKETFIWPELGRLIKNYEPFVEVNNLAKFRKLAINKVKEFQTL